MVGSSSNTKAIGSQNGREPDLNWRHTAEKGGGLEMENIEHRYYKSLFDIAATLNSAGDPEEVLRCIVETLTKAVGATGSALLLLTPDRKELHHSVDYGLSPSYIRKGPVLVEGRFPEVLDGKAVAILDVAKDPRIQYCKEAKQEGIVSILSVPMRLKGEVIGVLNLYTHQPRRFSEEDIHFVSGVANLGAIALDNARRHDRLRKDYETSVQELLYWGRSSRGS
jgi:GAF domain-containing protein